MTTLDFEQKTKELIDNLKGICASYGLGNDGNEFKIITQVFLYKFINDKFAFEVKKIDKKTGKSENWEQALTALPEDDYEMLLLQLKADTARLKPDHFISKLFEKQNEPDFAKLFDDTLRDIAITNNDIFAVKTEGGGKYAEYYTPHAVAKIMGAILVTEHVQNVTCYDPSAGSGTLLMNIAHAIGEERCTIYSQDISQKSSSLLRLNLILNNLVHSIQNIIQGNTLLHPYHKEKRDLIKFDYIVSNPPFKMDFSDFSNDLDTKENNERFFAGIPNIPKKAKDKMAIYQLFLQHIIYSLKKDNGKAAVVVPTGFITAQSGIDKRIRQRLVDDKMLAGVVSMPSNIFATTGTNVSILFIDKANKGDVVLIDASGLGEKVKGFTDNLNNLFDRSHDLEKEIKKQLSGLKYE